LDFLDDKSVQRILLIATGVLALFGVYFGLAVASNRSVRRLAETLRRRKNSTRQVEIKPASRLMSWPVAVLVLTAAAAGLIAFLIWTTKALR